VHTMQEAKDLVDGLFLRQVDRARAERVQPNLPCQGDREARDAFLLLLSTTVQRSVFLKHCKNASFWPRIRSLVGSPPFCFLLEQDEHILNASGIASRRAHMAHLKGNGILNSLEIGTGHYEDEFGRVAKVVASASSSSVAGASESLVPFRLLTTGRRIVMDMRLPKKTHVERMSIAKHGSAVERRSVLFPNVGERLNLHLNSALRDRNADEQPATVVVRSRQQRSQNSPIVRLFCIVE
jgi:hypothetical protein